MGARFWKLSRPYLSCHLLSGEHEEGSAVETRNEELIPCAHVHPSLCQPFLPQL